MATTDVTSTQSASTTAALSTAGTGAGLNSLTPDQFLKMMIAELKNQDPLNPMDNSQLLQEISQMRTIGVTQQLSDTLNSVLLGQNVATGSSLINKQVKALGNDGQEVTGKVDSVSVVSGQVTLNIGESTATLANVKEISP